MFKYEYLHEFETICEFTRVTFRGPGWCVLWRKLRWKILWNFPFNKPFLFYLFKDHFVTKACPLYSSEIITNFSILYISIITLFKKKKNPLRRATFFNFYTLKQFSAKSLKYEKTPLLKTFLDIPKLFTLQSENLLVPNVPYSGCHLISARCLISTAIFRCRFQALGKQIPNLFFIWLNFNILLTKIYAKCEFFF
jgi:hypothetical protein